MVLTVSVTPKFRGLYCCCAIRKYSYVAGVGTNSGMDYWNGTLDWTTGLSYFSFLDRFMCIFLHFSKYLATMDDISNDNRFLQCFHKYI